MADNGDSNGSYTPPIYGDPRGMSQSPDRPGVAFLTLPPTRPDALTSQVELHGDVAAAEKYVPLVTQQMMQMHQGNVNNLEIVDRPVDLGDGKRMLCQRRFTADKAMIYVPKIKTSSWEGVGPDPSTRQVYVRLSWNTYADLDLWVTDPCGTKIFYGNKESTCQGLYGFLDVDANAGNYTLSPVEIISWVTAPKGNYLVQVNYYADHEGSPGVADFSVYTKTPSGDLGTFSGTLYNVEGQRTQTVASFTVL